jgi:hypothetical protein
MTPAGSTRVLLAAVLAVAAVGALDAGIGREWELAVLFGAVAVLGLVLLARTRGRRRATTLRADRAAALADRALRTGEPLDQLTDRAVATYLDALAEPDQASGP